MQGGWIIRGCDSLKARRRVVDAGWGAQVYRVTGLAGLLHSTVKGIRALDQLAIADINPFHHQRKQPPRQTCIAFCVEPFYVQYRFGPSEDGISSSTPR